MGAKPNLDEAEVGSRYLNQTYNIDEYCLTIISLFTN